MTFPILLNTDQQALAIFFKPHQQNVAVFCKPNATSAPKPPTANNPNPNNPGRKTPAFCLISSLGAGELNNLCLIHCQSYFTLSHAKLFDPITRLNTDTTALPNKNNVPKIPTVNFLSFSESSIDDLSLKKNCCILR